MNPVETLGLALGTGFSSGLNLYATIATLGFLQRFGVIHLPASLQVLAHPWILGIAVALYLIEFFADKIPYVDTAWDAIHTVIRPPAIYGPRDREIFAFFKSIKLGVLPLLGSPESKLSMIYGPDCARACIRAIDADVPSGSIFAVDDGAVHTMAELIREAESALGKRAFLRIPLPRRVVEGAALLSESYGKVTNRAMMLTRDKCNELFDQWVCDGASAKLMLGFTPSMSFADGVKHTVDWYRQAGWL